MNGAPFIFVASAEDDRRLIEHDLATFYTLVANISGVPSLTATLFNRVFNNTIPFVLSITTFNSTEAAKDAFAVGYRLSDEGAYTAAQSTLARLHHGYELQIENTAGGTSADVTVEVHYSRTGG